MKLLSLTISGFRRFLDETSVRLDERLIALVGPNEAGKTSLLRALQLLNDDTPIPAGDRTRRANRDPRITLRLSVDDDDRAALAAIPEARDVQQVQVTKTAAAGRPLEILPDIHRDRSARDKVLSTLGVYLKGEEDGQLDRGTFPMLGPMSTLRGQLSEADETLGLATLELIRELGGQEAETPAGFPNIELLVQDLNRLREIESVAPPRERAADILSQRLPRFLYFDDPARALAGEYDLNAILQLAPEQQRPYQALFNLAHLAGLDLAALRAAIGAGDVGEAEHLVQRANRRLKKVFNASWKQHDVTVRLKQEGFLLRLLAAIPQELGYSPMDERSDGLRWFIALRAFLSRPESVKPILLVDEAESHLHYDAQADLVAVLEAQDLAASVIYTTHSVGCLPSDLGTGIRLVVVKDAQHSTLDNSFWSSGPGITPLLFGMGARLLAFTAIRVVVLAEGPSECVLLPTLLREATDRDDVGFRIVPGLAVVADDDFDTLAQEAARMGFLVDGDPGGRRIRDKLVGAGVDARKIIALRDLADNGLQLEDLVSVDTFVAAVNEEIQRWQPGRPTIQRTDVETGDHRMDAVKKWCSANGVNVPSKVALAQRVVDRRVLGPCLVSPTHLHALRRTYWELWTGLTL